MFKEWTQFKEKFTPWL